MGRAKILWQYDFEFDFSKLLFQQIHDSVDVRNRRQGTYRTKYVFPDEPDFPGNWNEFDNGPEQDAHCLPLVVESLREGSLVDRKCLEIQPTWMSR